MPKIDLMQIFRQRKRLLYTLVFKNTEGRQVLEDLASFCFLDSSTFDKDPQVTARNEGRRQVVLYILEALNLNVTDIGDAQNGTYGDSIHASGNESSIHGVGSYS